MAWLWHGVPIIFRMIFILTLFWISFAWRCYGFSIGSVIVFAWCWRGFGMAWLWYLLLAFCTILARVYFSMWADTFWQWFGLPVAWPLAVCLAAAEWLACRLTGWGWLADWLGLAGAS